MAALPRRSSYPSPSGEPRLCDRAQTHWWSGIAASTESDCESSHSDEVHHPLQIGLRVLVGESCRPRAGHARSRPVPRRARRQPRGLGSRPKSSTGRRFHSRCSPPAHVVIPRQPAVTACIHRPNGTHRGDGRPGRAVVSGNPAPRASVEFQRLGTTVRRARVLPA